MEPVSETDQEQVPEDLGKLTEADKAHTGRVSCASLPVVLILLHTQLTKVTELLLFSTAGETGYV